jgi:hypothetical protein
MKSIDVEQAFVQGVQEYLAGCRARVPLFVREHYRYPGAWHNNRVAFGWDLLRAPLNLFWAPVYVSIVLLGFALSLCGLKKLGDLLRRAPGGLSTKVQNQIAQKIKHELFLFEQLENSQCLENCIARKLQVQVDEFKSPSDRLVNLVEESLKQLKVTRTASADITNTIFSTGIGAIFFKKFTPGGIGIGFLLAAYLAQQQAISSFFLGDTLGSWYYGLFPAKADLAMKLISVALVLFIFSIFASFSGLISDPLQAHIRLHHRRLNRMLRHLEDELIRKQGKGFRPKDAYVARLFELADAVKSLA